MDGDALLGVGWRVMEDYAAGLTELKQVVRHRSHGLAIAALPTLAATLLPQVVAQLQKEVPDSTCCGRDGSISPLTGVDVVHKDLSYTEIFREPFALLSHRDQRPQVTTWLEAAIAALPIFSMPRGRDASTGEAAFLRAGAQFSRCWNCGT